MFYGGQEAIFNQFLFKMRKKIAIDPKPCLRMLCTEHNFLLSFQTTEHKQKQ